MRKSLHRNVLAAERPLIASQLRGSSHAAFVLPAIAVAVVPNSALGWTVESIVTPACHEQITAEALRRTESGRSLASSANRRSALADHVAFDVPADAESFEAVSLLVGVRYPDLGGHCPTDLATLPGVRNYPGNEAEHSLRERWHDGEIGDRSAADDCRDFIRDQLQLALESQAGSRGEGDGTTVASICLRFQGETDVDLSAFHFQFGPALHAFQDTFTHTYRVGGGLEEIAEVSSWLEAMDRTLVPERDGPPHASVLDDCERQDPRALARREAATQASAELIEAVTAPVETEQERDSAIDAVLDRWLTHRPGCTLDNSYCGSPAHEEVLDDAQAGCSATAKPAAVPFDFVVVALCAMAVWGKR